MVYYNVMLWDLCQPSIAVKPLLSGTLLNAVCMNSLIVLLPRATTGLITPLWYSLVTVAEQDLNTGALQRC